MDFDDIILCPFPGSFEPDLGPDFKWIVDPVPKHYLSFEDFDKLPGTVNSVAVSVYTRCSVIK